MLAYISKKAWAVTLLVSLFLGALVFGIATCRESTIKAQREAWVEDWKKREKGCVRTCAALGGKKTYFQRMQRAGSLEHDERCICKTAACAYVITNGRSTASCKEGQRTD